MNQQTCSKQLLHSNRESNSRSEFLKAANKITVSDNNFSLPGHPGHKKRSRRKEKELDSEVDTKLSSCDTPLIVAAKEGNDTEIEVLLKNGAKVNTRCVHERTALWYAVSNGYLKSAEKLLLFGADVNVKDIDGITPLIQAATLNLSKLLKTLISFGADVNAQCNNGRNALQEAAFFGHIKCVKQLLKVNCEKNSTDNKGRTPLIASLYRGYKEVASYLIEHNVNFNMQCKIGRSALHYAAARGYFHICKDLVEAGATIDLKDIYDKTPLMLAAAGGYKSIVDYLINNGAQITVQDTFGKTALECATIRQKINTSEESESSKGPRVNYDDTIAFLNKYKTDLNADISYGKSMFNLNTNVPKENYSLQLVISRKNNFRKGFTESELREFVDKVCEALVSHKKQYEFCGVRPIFTDIKRWNSQLLVTASNEESKKWLCKVLPHICPWPDVKFVSSDPNLFPIRDAIIRVPCIDHPTNKEFLNELTFCNKELDCTQWKILERKVEANYLNMTVELDNSTYKLLEKLNFFLNFGVVRVEVMIKTKNNDEQ